MNSYLIVLFLHVLGAAGLFMALGLEGFVTTRLRVSKTLADANLNISAFDRLKLLYVPSYLGVLIGGLYLGSIVGSKDTLWLAVALAGTLLTMLIGGLLTGVQMSKLKALIKSSAHDSNFDEIAARLQGRLLALSYGIRVGITLGIVFLMTTKPDLSTSVTALVLGGGLGLILATRLTPQRGSGSASNVQQTAGTIAIAREIASRRN